MASRLWHGALSSSLLQLLLVVILVTAIECEPLTSSPISANQHSFTVGSTHRQEQEETGRVERVVGLQAELPDVGELQREVNRGKMMATERRTAIKSWPDLVGLDVEEAKKKILEEHPNLLVQIVPEGNFMSMDFNTKRVRIHKNKEEKVARIPR